ncbi:MAG: NADPH-dependent 2,4-dienoyl-CoA reductase [Bdellovibrionales bacterium]|nr:NADPH-dependent 2,4-dienoyl-CoA reductase [Bdellovibrionales bacterium]
MSSKYPHLFTPIDVHGVRIENRVIMGSIHTGLEGNPFSLQKLSAFYEERAKAGVGMIVTGGISPNRRGWLLPFSGKMSSYWDVRLHRQVTERIKAYPTKMLCQLLHAGRYAVHPFSLAPSAIQSPITKFAPTKMSLKQVRECVQDFIHAASCAHRAGYDGVEVMGSEGYLIHQFFSHRTNRRSDEYGHDLKGRIRFAKEIIEGIRQKLGHEFLIMFRLPMIDLLPDGNSFEEVLELAKELEVSGVSILNSGIGWHESRVPTIASMVPQAAFAWLTQKFKQYCKVPLVASNRINTPEIAEDILSQEMADFVSLARPFLADPQWTQKAKFDQGQNINVCIACNQACLDHIFQLKRASCLVNPQACYETEKILSKSLDPKKVLVVGAGPAGLACAYYAAKAGHQVELWEKSMHVGGQFTLASKIPGKEEFAKTIDFYRNQLFEMKVLIEYGKEFSDTEADQRGFDHIVFATGVKARIPEIQGISHPKVIFYDQLLSKKEMPKSSYAIVGAGGIGFDVAEFLSHQEYAEDPVEQYAHEWGIDRSLQHPGGLTQMKPEASRGYRNIYLLQRKKSKPGKNLSKTTGWIRRKTLEHRGVKMMSGIEYQKIDDHGLHILVDGHEKILEVDQVVICAGQVSVRPKTQRDQKSIHYIGGCKEARELDAKTAIEEAFDVATRI